MLALEGVYAAKFCLCMMDMKTVDAAGQEVPARKRMTLITISTNIAEVLRRAQCDGARAPHGRQGKSVREIPREVRQAHRRRRPEGAGRRQMAQPRHEGV